LKLCPHSLRKVKLYAEFATARLIDLLRASNDNNLENVCTAGIAAASMIATAADGADVVDVAIELLSS
jgi:pyruvate/oxaloacetate carboxyltransferase